MTDYRRRPQWANFFRPLVDGRYKYADKVVLVMDRLNTHTAASLYEALAPTEAKRIADKLDIHRTPKHGSWLSMAKIELSALGRQCLSQRIAQRRTLTKHKSESTAISWPLSSACAAPPPRRAVAVAKPPTSGTRPGP